jgi:hypothetical protein
MLKMVNKAASSVLAQSIALAKSFIGHPIVAFNNGTQRGVSMTSYVIGIAVAALVVAIIIPVAFSQFFATVTTSWDAQTILIWGIIPVIVILAIVLFFLNKADDQS